MTVIVLKHTGPLGLPGGTVLRPGVPASVENWRILQHHGVVRQWLDAGILEVKEDDGDPAIQTGGGQSGNGQSGEGDKKPEDDEQIKKMKAEAKELGIVVHYRWSAEKIQEEIDKKLAE